MLLAYSLVIYGVVLIVLCWVFYHILRLGLWASVGLAMLVSLILLVFLSPPFEIDVRSHPVLVLIYVLIGILSLLVILFYFAYKACYDYRDKICTLGAKVD